jgi:hypothetical protein
MKWRWWTFCSVLLLLVVAYSFWPRDRFAMLRQFQPEEHGSYPTASQVLEFKTPANKVRAVLGLAPGKEGYFKLPNGETALFHEYHPDLRPYTCNVSVLTNEDRWLSDPIIEEKSFLP